VTFVGSAALSGVAVLAGVVATLVADGAVVEGEPAGGLVAVDSTAVATAVGLVAAAVVAVGVLSDDEPQAETSSPRLTMNTRIELRIILLYDLAMPSLSIYSGGQHTAI